MEQTDSEIENLNECSVFIDNDSNICMESIGGCVILKRNSSQATPLIPNEGSKGKPTLPTDGSTGLNAGTPISSGGANTDENGPACMVTLPSATCAWNGSCVTSNELGQNTGKQKGTNNCGTAVMAKGSC